MKIDFRSLSELGRHWRGIGVTLFINWAIKPFSMALLAWLFIGWLFRPLPPPSACSASSRAPRSRPSSGYSSRCR
ncbi:hypothetical protein OVA00_26835 [Ensifer sp. SL37]|nr:hypothetical protein [Ensifer sp. SL37]